MADPARYYIDPVYDHDGKKAWLHHQRSPSGDWIKWADFEDYKAAQRRNRNDDTVTRLGTEIVELRSRLAELEQFEVLLDKPKEGRDAK